MHRLLAAQTAKATNAAGEVELETLYALVSEAYEQFDDYRIRTRSATRRVIGQARANDKARQAALDHLARQNRILDAALAHMAQGVAMFDADQRLVVCNPRFVEIYGLPASLTVAGTHFTQLARFHRNKHFPADNPPPEYAADGMDKALWTPNSVHQFRDGRVIAIARRPMQNGGWVTTHDDITERELLHAELKLQHEIVKEQQEQLLLRTMRFDAAINNMTEGLCFFSGDQRLIICNERFVEMYGLRPGSVYPGMTLAEVIKLRHEAGYHPLVAPEEYHAQRNAIAASNRVSDTEIELANGRIFEIHHRPMPDGGWVATHDDITERRRAEAKVAYMAHHDMLTDLPNRTLLIERLAEAVARTHGGELIAFHLFDLDHFKDVNDTLGHPAGDKLLRQAARRLRDLIGDGDTLARMGGDEFAIVQGGLTHPLEAAVLAKRVVQAINTPFDIDGHEVIVGASIGIAVCPVDGEQGEELIRNADLALYRSKAEGRCTYRFFEPGMDGQMKIRRGLESDLRKAITLGEFELHYQPVADLRTSTITGCEALLRWRHPQKGMILPDAFIPLAEEIGAIIPLGEWVIREACRTAASWPDTVKVSVNLSPVQFHGADLCRVVLSALAASGLEPQRLELEITENVLLINSKKVVATFNRLRDLGVRVALDDFGAGHSSLAYLRQFPFDNIKIDRSFVQDIAESPSSRCIVQAIAEMAQGLSMISTAEGVETAEQKAAVLSAGCSEMQGYLLSRAVPAEEIAELFRRGVAMAADGTADASGDGGPAASGPKAVTGSR
jgi:diguanylate cyclase (GGDEF)-like protein